MLIGSHEIFINSMLIVLFHQAREVFFSFFLALPQDVLVLFDMLEVVIGHEVLVEIISVSEFWEFGLVGVDLLEHLGALPLFPGNTCIFSFLLVYFQLDFRVIVSLLDLSDGLETSVKIGLLHVELILEYVSSVLAVESM